MYDSGLGVPEDDVEAAEWFRKAAEQGYAGGQCNLGVMYAEGREASSRMTLRLSTGISRPLSREMHRHSIVWPICMTMVEVSRRMTLRL